MPTSPSLHLSYWRLSLQFWDLFQAAVEEMKAQGNAHVLVTNTAQSTQQYNAATKWSDFNLAVALLFNLYHGLELILKGFCHAGSTEPPKHHKLSELLRLFENQHPQTPISQQFKAFIEPPEGSLLHGFFELNGLQIDSWYEALKYPQLKGGQLVSHASLEYKRADGLQAWTDLSESVENLRRSIVSYARSQGYA
jgi:HEPN domain